MTVHRIVLIAWLIALQCVAQEQPAGAPRPVPPPRTVIRGNEQNPFDTTYALDLYAKLTGKIVLQGQVPPLREQFEPPESENTNAVIAYIEAALRTSGITILPLRTNFVYVVPSAASNAFAGPLEAVKVQDLTNAAEPGTIAFPNMDLETFLDFYAKIANKTFIRSALPAVTIRLMAQKPLTAGEAAYAMQVTLLLNGVATIDDGEKFVQVVPAPVASQVRARAPKAENGAKLIPISEIPVFKPGPAPIGTRPAPRKTNTNTNQTVGERIGEAATNIRNAILGPPPPAPGSVQKLAEYYAKLVGKELEVSPQVGSRNLCFQTRVPLTKTEILYAIEATLALDGLAIIPVDDKSVRVGKLSELPAQTK